MQGIDYDICTYTDLEDFSLRPLRNVKKVTAPLWICLSFALLSMRGYTQVQFLFQKSNDFFLPLNMSKHVTHEGYSVCIFLSD